jgi:hypothetical protein
VARDAFAFVAAIDWTPVLVAVIAMIGSLGSAAISAYVVLQLRTPSGMSIGKQVEGAHLTTVGNSHRITALAARLGVPETAEPLKGDEGGVRGNVLDVSRQEKAS